MTRRRWLIIVLAGAAFTLLFARLIARIYTDYLWYASLGAADVWRARYASLVTLRLFCAVSASLFVFANLYAVRQSVVSLVLPRRIGNLDIGEEVPRPQLTWTAGILAILIGSLLAWLQNDWSTFLAARIGLPFGESDPYFAADLGFFVYQLPFELALFAWTMTTVLIVIGIVVMLYALTPSLRWEQGRMYVSGYVRRHLTMLAGVLLLVLAWHYRLDMYTILGHGSAADGAFTSLDHRVGIPANLVLSLVTLGAGIVVVWAGWTGQLRMAFAALTGVILAVLAARQVAPFLVSRFAGDRDPAVRERPYEATRAGYTRRAFAVHRVATADTGVMFETLSEAAPFVPIWDDGALRRATDRVIAGAGVAWFASDSGLTASVPTHANAAGATTYLAGGADQAGGPLRASVPERPDRPPLYILADSSAPPLRVADHTGHIAAPSLEGSATRLLHALSMRDLRVWVGELPSPAPKLLTRRTVRERLDALTPFFAQGSSVSPIWVADSLVWAVELYSSSRTYPLSRRQIIGGTDRAYFQHAATALVNATTGRVVLVADTLADPVAATWRARFYRLFVRPASLPLGLRRQLPPARDGARAQASALGRYGRRDEVTVPSRLPDDAGPDSALAGTPAPLIGLPRLGSSAYVLPLLDGNERMRGLFLALGGPTHRSIWLPAGDDAPVWREALDRLRAADTMSGASLLVRGFVRAVPVGGRIVLVQPRYDWRGEGAPRLMYVSALVGDSVRSGATLLQLAGRLPDAEATTTDARARAIQLYDEMRRALARGDWVGYGRAFDALGALLKERRE